MHTNTYCTYCTCTLVIISDISSVETPGCLHLFVFINRKLKSYLMNMVHVKPLYKCYHSESYLIFEYQ